MRGKDQGCVLVCFRMGITPACEGKRTIDEIRQAYNEDHPRMCGEKLILRITVRAGIGSPPHVRGKASTIPSYTSISRITPACAGKSCKRHENRTVTLGSPPHVRGKGTRAYQMISIVWDHPRMCGEKLTPRFLLERYKGSPPHVRGKVIGFQCNHSFVRITPACAGKRLKKSALYHSFGSHKPHFSFSFKYTSFISKQSSSALCD